MPAAPKEKAASTSREKGKGKEKDHDGGGKDKEPKQRKKPGRVPTSCAECRRLKLRCDRNVPCTKCVSRGCASICPDGTLAPGKGNRLVLANTEELHARIDVMADRNRALEKALADLYSQSRQGQGGLHPLLAEGRLELGDLGRLSVAGDSGGLGSTSESSRSSLMVPTPSPRASTSASASMNSPTSQSHSHPHSQSRSPAPERQVQTSVSTLQPQRWREVPAVKHLQKSDGDDSMELDLDPDDGHDKDSEEFEMNDADDEHMLHDLDAKGTLFVGDSDFSSSKGGGSGGGRSSYHYLGRSARPEFLAQIIPSASTSFNFSSLAQIRAILPERDVALSLCDVYLTYGTSMYNSAMARAQLEQIMRGVYRAMEHSPSASSTLISDTAFFLAALALGALFSPALAPYSDEARRYYVASQATLDMLPHDVNETVIQTMLHLTHFAELVSNATSSPSSSSSTLRSTNDGSKVNSHDAAWTHAGHGVRLAQRMGLHVSPSSWPSMSGDEKTRRDDMWWGLFVADTWTSFNVGRPPAISRAYVDCAMPVNRTLPSHVDLVTSDSDSMFHSWYLHFTLLLYDALDTIVVGPKPNTSAYASVLEHDRRIRDFYVPRAWRMSSSASAGGGHPTHGYERADSFAEDDGDADAIEEDVDPVGTHYSTGGSGNGRKKDEEEMYRWLVMSAKEIVLLKLHQPYFVQALKAREPTASGDEGLRWTPYLPSVLAVYRSMRRLSQGLAHTWAMIPKFLARVGTGWSHGLSAAVTAALLVTRAPDSDLASSALDELSTLVSVFGVAAPGCRPARNMLSLVRDLHQTAVLARSRRYRGSDIGPNNVSHAELERLNGKTTFLYRSPVLPSGPHHGNPFEQSSSSLSITLQHQYQQKLSDYERHEPRPRSRATSATMSDFATDTHYNQPHTLTHPHNTHYTPQSPHQRHGSRTHKLSRFIMEKLHPTLTQDMRIFEEQGSLSNVGVMFHDSPSDTATFHKEKTPQRHKIAETPTSFSPQAMASTASLPPSAYHSQQGSIYRNQTPPPNQPHHHSYPQSSVSEDQYHSQRASPNPPRLIVNPYMSPKAHVASVPSSMHYLDDNHQRGQAYSESHSYSQTQAHIPQQSNYHAASNVYQRHQREQPSYQYSDIDGEDLSNAITSGFYASESRVRSGVGNTGSHSSIGDNINLNNAASTANSVIANISTTTTTTATMSTGTGGGFMPHPFVLGPLPNGFQSGFFPAGFSSGFFPPPIVLDPSWNSFVEQLGF